MVRRVLERSVATAWTPADIARAAGGTVRRTGAAAGRMVTSSRDVRPGDCFVALRGPKFDGHDYVGDAIRAGAVGVVVDRSLDELRGRVGPFVVRVRDTGEALLGVARQHRSRTDARIVGITGSCGKTSTKDMLGGVLAATMPSVASPSSYNNAVGVPLSLLQITPETQAAVIEIGTNAPGEIAALTDVVRPDIGVLTCVREAHLEGLGDIDGVAREKASLFDHVIDDGVAILNLDDAACRKIAGRVSQRVVGVGIYRDAPWKASHIKFHGIGTTFRINDELPVTLPMLGTHNVYNALLCVAAAAELGVEPDVAIRELSRLRPSSRRLEFRRFGDLKVFDDTHNMNPASAGAALQALGGIDDPGRKIVVFGEMLELGAASLLRHRELGAEVATSGADVLVAVGKGAEPIAEGCEAAGMSSNRIVRANDPMHALDLLTELIEDGDLLLCKASRGVALDRLVDGLARSFGVDTTRDEGGAVEGAD